MTTDTRHASRRSIWTIAISTILASAVLGVTGVAFGQIGFNTEPLVPHTPAEQVSPHIWVIKAFPNIFFVVGQRATLVVDTGMGARNGAVVAREARRLSTKGQKLYLTTTHFHPEHASGDGGFPPDTVVIRPKEQQAELERDGAKAFDFFRALSPAFKDLLADAQVRKAQVVFDRDHVLDLGGVTARLMWRGPAHTRGDELVYVEQDRALISGDVVQNRLNPTMTCDECTPRTWLAVLDEVAPLKPLKILPDHGDFGGPELIAQERDFLSDLQARTTALKAQGKSAEEASRVITSEFATKYAGWAGIQALGDSVAKAYKDVAGGTAK